MSFGSRPRLLHALVLTLSLAGCVTAPVALLATVTAADLAAYAAAGERSIAGQAFMRQSGGGIVTCAGEDAVLLPAVPVVDEAMKLWRDGDEVDVEAMPFANVAGSVRWSTCDAAGNFVFEGLPALTYWLAVPVRWTVARDAQGGMLTRRVSLEGASEPRLILADDDAARLTAKPWLLTDRLN